MTRTRKILLAAAGLVGLLALAGAALILTFDPNRYKGRAVDWMQAHYQRRLALDGPISLRVFPRLEVALEQVSLSEPGQPQQAFVKLESAKLAVRLWPLLSKQLVVDRIEAHGLQARVTRDVQGRRNFDDLLKPTPETPQAPGEPGQPLQLDISSIDLERLTLDVDDAKLPLRGQVQLASFSSGRLSSGSTAPVKLSATLKLTEPAVDASLAGNLQLQLDLGDAERPLKVDARAIDLRLKGALPGLKQIDTRLKGDAAFDGGTGAIQASDITLALAAELAGLRLADSQISLARFRYAPADQKIGLEALKLDVKGQLTNPDQPPQPLTLALQWPSLDVQGQQLKGSPLAGSFSVQGPAAVQGRIESGAPSGTFAQIALPAFKLVLGGASGANRITGSVQADLKIAPAAKQLALAALAIDAQVQNPALRAMAVQATGQANASPTAANWQLAGALNKQAFRTEGNATLGGARPRVQAQASFGELDLDALLPPRAKPTAAAKAPPPSKGGPVVDTPVDLAALRSLDGRITLEAGTLRYAPYVLRNLKATAALDNGRLDLNPLSFNTWDGSLTARVLASAAEHQTLAIQAQAQQIDIAAALKDVAQSELLEGHGQIQVDLRTGGRSLQALKSALDGTARMQLRDGAVRGFNLAKALRQFKAALTMQQDAVSQARQTEKTDFSELSASFQFNNGIGTSRDLDLKSPFLRLGGDGQVNLPASTLDYTVRASVINTSKGQGGADLAALDGVTVPVRLQGPFDALDWKIRWSEVAAGAATNTVKKQLGNTLREQLGAELGAPAASGAASQPTDAELRQKARDKLKEGLLKGLMR